MNNLKNLKNVFPDFPRTRHLPWKPNAVRDDLIASEDETKVLFESDLVYVEEKVDGANCGMALIDKEPVIRNRNHILSKAYRKSTPAKMQFSSIWNWFYSNKEKFEKLNEEYNSELCVYGEWMYALHGIEYDKLISLFIPFDLYDPRIRQFLDTTITHNLLESVGFKPVPLLKKGKLTSWEELEELCNQPSPYSSKDLREGVYVKVSNGKYITERYKMIRQGFVQGYKWNDQKITKNTIKV